MKYIANTAQTTARNADQVSFNCAKGMMPLLAQEKSISVLIFY